MSSNKGLLARIYRDYGAMFSGFVFRGMSVALGFVVTYFVGHHFGAAGSGYYALITQTGMLFSIVVLGGLDFAVVKEFSAAEAGARAVHRGSLWNLLRFICVSNAIFMAVFMLLPPEWAQKMIALKPGMTEYLMIAAIMLCRSITRLTGAFLRSQGELKMGQAVEVIFIPLIVIVAAAVVAYHSTRDVLDMTLLAGAVSAVIGIAQSFRHTGTSPGNLAVPVRKLIAEGLPLWGLGVSLNLADWYSVAVVSGVAGLSAAGVFRVAMQIGTTLMFGVSGVMAILSAQVARAHHRGDRAEVGRLNRKAVILNGLVAALPVTVLLVAAPWVLRMVGPEFVQGTAVLRVILFGQVLYALFSPAGQTLAMMGHGRINLMIVLVSTLGYLVLTPVLAYTMGMMGVAIAMILFLVGRSLACFVFLYFRVGINSLTGHVRALKA